MTSYCTTVHLSKLILEHVYHRTDTKTNVNGQGSRNEAIPLRLTAPVGTLPLKPSGALDDYLRKEITPAIGTEFPDANVADMLHAPNADELLRELAIMVSQRGFCVVPPPVQSKHCQ